MDGSSTPSGSVARGGSFGRGPPPWPTFNLESRCWMWAVARGRWRWKSSAALATRAASVGIDPGPEQIARARAKAARRHVPAEFQIGVIEQLPFPDQTFDVVLSTLMMHHLPASLKRQGLAEIARVLKPGGRLVIADFTRKQDRQGQAARFHAGGSSLQDLAALVSGCWFLPGGNGGDAAPTLLCFPRSRLRQRVQTLRRMGSQRAANVALLTPVMQGRNAGGLGRVAVRRLGGKSAQCRPTRPRREERAILGASQAWEPTPEPAP